MKIEVHVLVSITMEGPDLEYTPQEAFLDAKELITDALIDKVDFINVGHPSNFGYFK